MKKPIQSLLVCAAFALTALTSHAQTAPKILTVDLNRQRGSAWYLQGTDGTGAPAFRYLVNYGGKKLVCGGLLYKDAASNQLGDLRDKVIIQAKEICETLAL